MNKLLYIYILLFSGIYLLYKEVEMFKIYMKLKKANRKKLVYKVGSRPQLRSFSLFYAKTVDDSYKLSIKIKTTFFSSFIPRFIFGDFEVYVSEDYDHCVIKSPFQFMISWTILAFYIFIHIYLISK